MPSANKQTSVITELTDLSEQWDMKALLVEAGCCERGVCRVVHDPLSKISGRIGADFAFCLKVFYEGLIQEG